MPWMTPLLAHCCRYLVRYYTVYRDRLLQTTIYVVAVFAHPADILILNDIRRTAEMDSNAQAGP